MPNSPNSGRFKKGNPGNPNAKGRPRRETERAYLDATLAAVTIADWLAIVKTALTKAKAGEPRSREWLTRLLIGDPSAAGEETPGGGDESEGG